MEIVSTTTTDYGPRWAAPPDFHCRRELGTPQVLVVTRGEDHRPALRTPLAHVERHSPDGFEWGYAGSGPSDLALSIMCFFLGRAQAEEQGFYIDFRRAFIESLPEAGGWLEGGVIVAWLRDRGQQPPMAQQVFLVASPANVGALAGWHLERAASCQSHEIGLAIIASPKAHGALPVGRELARCLAEQLGALLEALTGAGIGFIDVQSVLGHDPRAERGAPTDRTKEGKEN